MAQSELTKEASVIPLGKVDGAKFAVETSPRGRVALDAWAREANTSITKDCLLVASYPRSGNTMTAVFLTLYGLMESNDPEAAQKIFQGPMSVQSPGMIFREAKRTAFIAPSPQRMIQPRVFPDPVLVAKTHLMRSALPADTGFRHVAEICLVRHPLDVLASSVNFLRMTERKRIERGAEPRRGVSEFINLPLLNQINRFIANKGVPLFQNRFGTWLDNVMGWSSPPPGQPSVALRYEDIVDDPVGTFARAFDKLGQPFDRERAKVAFETANTYKVVELGRGRNYLAKDLNPRLKAAARDAFGPALDRFGYEIK